MMKLIQTSRSSIKSSLSACLTASLTIQVDVIKVSPQPLIEYYLIRLIARTLHPAVERSCFTKRQLLYNASSEYGTHEAVKARLWT